MQGISIGVRAKIGMGFTSVFRVGSTLECQVEFCVEFRSELCVGLTN